MLPHRIFPLSEEAVTIEFGDTMSESYNDAAIAFARHFDANPFPGLVETVPAIASTTIFFDLVKLRKAFPGKTSGFEIVNELATTASATIVDLPTRESRVIEVPVSFEREDGLDLNLVADHSGVTTDEVIRIFLSKSYRVYMLGFLPGFAYMGAVDNRIAISRKSIPRLKVPPGSVGIAGNQTGIYPNESPGGWQIIGRTDIELINSDGDPSSCLFSPGDTARFVEVVRR